MPDSPFTVSALPDAEEALLSGIGSDEPEEQKRALTRYKEWIQRQYENKREEDYPVLANEMFHLLQSLYGGKRECEVLGFVNLTDIVLDYPRIIKSKLTLIISLLMEVIKGDITSSMVYPLVSVVLSHVSHW